MSPKDRDLLLEVVQVLDVVTAHCPPEMRPAYDPVIDSVEFITRAIDRDEGWFSRLRVVGSHWLILGEFFESVCGVRRAEFFVAEARKIVKAQGLLEKCEQLYQEMIRRRVCALVDLRIDD